jgi:hypothetical protein
MNRTALEQLTRYAKADQATHEAAEAAEKGEYAVTLARQAADALLDARDAANRHRLIVVAETVAAFMGRHFVDTTGVIYTAENGRLVKITPEPVTVDVAIPLVDIDGDGKFDNEVIDVVPTPEPVPAPTPEPTPAPTPAPVEPATP